MNVIDIVCEPGGSKPNEDRAGSAGNSVWVIDGATSLEESPFLPAGSDVQWLVDFVDEQLHRLAGLPDVTSGSAMIALLGKRVRRELGALGFPADRMHPTCSVGLCLDHGSVLELTRVGDVTCVSVGSETRELSTDYFSKREAAAVSESADKSLSPGEVRTRMLERRMTYVLGQQHEPVFSGHPDAAITPHTIPVSRSGSRYVLLCTDGFARALVDYHLYPDWRELIHTAAATGLPAVAREIRAFEALHTDRRHFKKADDLAAVLAHVERPATERCTS